MTGQLSIVTDIRSLLRENITAVLAVFDAHDPGLEFPNKIGESNENLVATYVCPCGLRATEGEWEQHLADKLADLLAQEGQ